MSDVSETYICLRAIEDLIEEGVPLFISQRNIRKYLREPEVKDRLSVPFQRLLTNDMLAVRWNRQVNDVFISNMASFIYSRISERTKWYLAVFRFHTVGADIRRRLNAVIMLGVALYNAHNHFGKDLYRFLDPEYGRMYLDYRMSGALDVDNFTHLPGVGYEHLDVLQALDVYGRVLSPPGSEDE